MFAGIGSAIVSLKRLGVAMAKIIHCEHDKVATHVYKYNHDANYNPKLLKEDGLSCEHVYYESFEEVEAQLEDILQEHGRT
jgi:site-specific DNA-cytosine methylase